MILFLKNLVRKGISQGAEWVKNKTSDGNAAGAAGGKNETCKDKGKRDFIYRYFLSTYKIKAQEQFSLNLHTLMVLS
jgi:hypothetical protein